MNSNNLKNPTGNSNANLVSNYLKSKSDEKEKATGQTAYDMWLVRLQKTLDWRRELRNGDQNWTRAYEMYKGLHWRDRDDQGIASDNVRDRITVNVTGSTILNMAPFLLASNPEFKCKPRKPEDVVSAQLQEATLNYEFKRREMMDQVDKCVLDCLTIGHGIIKTGFILEVDEAATKADGEINYDEYIQEESPEARRICPFLFLFDPSAPQHNLATARWCAEIFFKPVSDVIANTRYDSKVRTKIKEGVYTVTQKSSKFNSNNLNNETGNLFSMTPDQGTLPEEDLGIFYEVWDKKFKKYYVFADGVNEPLLEKDWPYPYLKNEFPYILVEYVPLPDEPYAAGIPYLIEDQQFELNRVRTSIFEHRRRFNRKYEALDKIDESEVNKLVEGEDGTIIRVPAIGSISPIPDAAISSDTQLTEAIIKQDVQELTGTDALLRGGNLPSRTTAGEVNTRTSIFRLKLDDRAKNIDKFLLKLGKQTLKHIKANYIAERVVKLVGEQGEYWKTFTPEDIQAEVDLEMETVSAPKVDPTMMQQQALQLWQISMQALPLVQAGMIKIDFNELFKWVMERFGNKDTGRFFKAALIPQAPLEEQKVNSNNLNQVPQITQPSPQQTQPQTPQDVMQQFQGAAISNGGFQ